MRIPINSLQYAYGERYFIRKLDLAVGVKSGKPAPGLGSACTMGVTTPDVVRERIRGAILADHRADAIIGDTKAGGTETYRDAFERFFGLPLEPEQEIAS